MKLIVQVLIVAAMSYSLEGFKLPAVGSGELAKDLQDLLDLVSMDKVLEVIRAYAAKDQEFQMSMSILSMDEVGAYMRNVEAAPEMIDINYFMQQSGLDVYFLIKLLHDRINFKNAVVPIKSDLQITGGLVGLATDIDALIPKEEVVALMNKKLAAGGIFAEYYKKCTSKEFIKFYLNSFKDINLRILVRFAEFAKLDGKVFEQLISLLVTIRAFVV